MEFKFTKFQLFIRVSVLLAAIISGIYFYFNPLTNREGNHNKIVSLYEEDQNMASGRMRIATFDMRTQSLLLVANPNFQNCELASKLLRRNQGNSKKYWCEKGIWRN
jgi:hypothetical protein